MLVSESYLKTCFMVRFISKDVYEKWMFFTNIANNYLLKIKKLNYSQLCIDCKSNKYIFERLIIQTVIESLFYFTAFQGKATLCTL